MVTSSSSNNLQELLREARKLGAYGSNAVYRRVLSLIELYASEDVPFVDGVEALRRGGCGGPDLGPVSTIPRWRSAASEVLQEYTRRSIMLDPVEAASTHMSEFLSGKVSVVEFRDEDLNVDYGLVDQKATELLRGKAPLVSVNYRMAAAADEVVAALRLLADEIERTGVPTADAAEHEGDLVMFAETCNVERSEVMSSRWSNNGQLYEQMVRDVIRCSARDACCGNVSYRNEFGPSRWVEVWRESGNPAQQPPVTPPKYTTSPWGNRLSVLTDAAAGTLTSDWGWRNLNGSTDFHGGIDVTAPPGTGVQSNVRGTIVAIVPGTDHHRGVIIRGFANETYTYWHVTPAAGLRVGDSVQPGTALGSLYDWADTHLHYAEHTPPNGDHTQRSDANSRNPLP